MPARVTQAVRYLGGIRVFWAVRWAVVEAEEEAEPGVRGRSMGRRKGGELTGAG